ncbi:Acetyltransferase (GNAT) family protein [Curtobacterium sp. UNCCL20]|uniref:GNAT family N-acetyltransferase n=1 Tax=Curtobacterium sp. UNCCL20 TaxID=1502773 RepID=UPI000883F760|nr:GNAT family N-acetyltransferase [Curtobacterium sp. UNCCL20]SDR03654.1 Acetyltransferase (GNAT) family protein [Curtobacterium sp. UNCCL20]
MHIRDCTPLDLPALTELTIETFRPLLAGSLVRLRPEATAHDHGHWEDDYRHEVPSLLAPGEGRFITLAEEDGKPLGYVGWNTTGTSSGRLEMVAVRPDARRRGVARALCSTVLSRLEQLGVTVVHIGTGGDEFHAPARALYESLGFVPYPTVDYARAL